MASEENKDPDWTKLEDSEKYKHYVEKGFYRLTGAQKSKSKNTNQDVLNLSFTCMKCPNRKISVQPNAMGNMKRHIE